MHSCGNQPESQQATEREKNRELGNLDLPNLHAAGPPPLNSESPNALETASSPIT